MQWPFLDLTTMSSDAANTVLTLISVAYFALLVEDSAVIREMRKSAESNYNQRLKRAARNQTIGTVVIGVLFVFNLVPLVGVINGGHASGFSAVLLWITSAVQFIGITLNLIVASLARDE